MKKPTISSVVGFSHQIWLEIHTSSKTPHDGILSIDAYFQNSWMGANFRGVLIFILGAYRHMTFTFPVIYFMPSGSFTADFCSVSTSVDYCPTTTAVYQIQSAYDLKPSGHRPEDLTP